MLSILAKAVPTLKGRKVGCLVTDGTSAKLVAALKAAVLKAGAKFEVVAPKIGGVTLDDGKHLPADHKIEGGPSILFDAVAILPSEEGGVQLALQAEAVNFLRDAFAHLKVIAHLPTTAPLLAKAGMSDADADNDAGLILLDAKSVADFIQVASGGRIWDREPMIHPVP
jgi:catalase